MNPGDPFGRAMIAVAASLAARTGEAEAFLAQFPFLADYIAADAAAPPLPQPPGHPLARLAAAGVSAFEIELLLAVGLAEEDPRLALLLGVGGERPLFGQLAGLFAAGGPAKIALGRLIALGLVRVCDPSQPRALWPLAVPVTLWDALAGEASACVMGQLIRRAELVPLERFLAPPALRPQLETIAAGVENGDLLVIRGPAANGRATLAGSIAHTLGLDLLRLDPAIIGDADGWREAGALATLTGALPLLAFDFAPGEERHIPPHPLWPGPTAVKLGRAGAVRGSGRVLTVALPRPDPAARLAHWRAALPFAAQEALRPLAEGSRATGGAIRRAAAGHATPPSLAELKERLRAAAAPALETVAQRLDPPVQPLLLDSETRRSFDLLLARCRHAEALAGAADHASGVRALFAGPSGTGKTLAARALADALGRDLWRIDLAAAVSKWIGETEKNLERAFAAAEEHDCMLLLDEGDALLAKRTQVGSSTDRYANLETSFLLQRIERFEGLLVVTTNAFDRIDTAFTRRMDQVLRFAQPDECARHAILVQHLGAHRMSDELLHEVAIRCALSGGQLRNIALAARVLGLADGALPGDGALREAVAQEFRKTDLPCPLKPVLTALAS